MGVTVTKCHNYDNVWEWLLEQCVFQLLPESRQRIGWRDVVGQTVPELCRCITFSSWCTYCDTRSSATVRRGCATRCQLKSFQLLYKNNEYHKLHEECWWGAHLPYLGLESVGRWTTQVCDAWPVRRQTYGYLPRRRTSLRRDWYQFILAGDRGTCVCQQLAQGRWNVSWNIISWCTAVRNITFSMACSNWMTLNITHQKWRDSITAHQWSAVNACDLQNFLSFDRTVEITRYVQCSGSRYRKEICQNDAQAYSNPIGTWKCDFKKSSLATAVS